MNPVAIRLLNQQLIAPQFNTPTEVVSYMGAMQAQEYRMMRWAVAMRINYHTPNNRFTSSDASSLTHCFISSRVRMTTMAYFSTLSKGNGPFTKSPRSISCNETFFLM